MSHLSFMYSEILAHPKGLTNQPTKSMDTVHIEKPVVCEISGFTAVSMKMTSFWEIAPYSLEVDRRFRDVYCLHQSDESISMMMESV
jgi:hypothetical protein